jgi:alpha-beta hydrolase superfamily lysophospholipase
MAWPQATDYNLAIQNPAVCFEDAELRQGQAAGLMGLPRPYSGGAADVYQMQCPDGTWAVKCFTREVHGLHERYQAISDHLRSSQRAFMVEFYYLERGILVKGAWYPVVKMRWVEGFTLNEFLRLHVEKQGVLDRLAHLWLKLARDLRDSEMGHGDLQHGNVMLVPGKGNSLVLRLIDYDGMYVPELANNPSGELGHANYQHPDRLSKTSYSAEIDRFAHLVIYTALRCLRLGGRPMWDKHDTGDNLLFRRDDIEKPRTSKLLPELWALGDRDTRLLLAHLVVASAGPLERVPLLEELVDNGSVRPLFADEEMRFKNLVALPDMPPARPPSKVVKVATGNSGLRVPPPLPVPLTPEADAEQWSDGNARPEKKTWPALPDPDKPLPAWLPQAIPLEGGQPVAAAQQATAAPEAIPLSGSAASAVAVPIPAAPVAIVLPLPVNGVPPVPTLEVVPIPIREDDTPVLTETLSEATGVLEVVAVEPAAAGSTPEEERKGLMSPELQRILLLIAGGAGGVLLLALLVWIVWPARTPRVPPPPPSPTIEHATQLTLKGGETHSIDVIVKRPAEWSAQQAATDPLQLKVEGLPKLVQAVETALPADQAVGHIPITADKDAPDGVYPVVVTLWNGASKLAEQRTTVKVDALPVPRFRPVENLVLRIGEQRTVSFGIDRRGRNEPLVANLDGLPDKVQQRSLISPPGQETVSIELFVPAELDQAVKIARLALWLGERKVDETPVTVSINKQAAVSRLVPPVDVKLAPGSKAEFRLLAERQGDEEPIDLKIGKLPAGVSISPGSATLPPAVDIATFEVQATEDVAVGPYVIRVQALSGGKVVAETTFNLQVARLMTDPPPDMPRGPDLPRAPSQVVNIVTADQVQLTGTFYSGGKDKSGQCVLMLHDLGKNRSEEGWVKLAESLQRQGHHVLAIDFRGHGDSTQVTNAFWTQASNKPLKGNRTGPAATNIIHHADFPADYCLHLIDDIAAARSWLDTRNDLGEVNSSNLVLVGAGEGAALGLLWMTAEAFRRERNGTKIQGKPELHKVAGAVWLTPSSTLGPGLARLQMSNALIKAVGQIGRSGERPSIGLLYGGNDAVGGVQTLALAEQVRRTLGNRSVRSVANTAAAGMELLKPDLDTEKQVVASVREIFAERELIVWAAHNPVGRTYAWNFSNSPTLAKSPGQRQLAPVPVDKLLSAP